MELYRKGAAKRLILSLAAGAVLSGCVYAPPPYAAYDTAPAAAPYYYSPYAYSYPTYVGPPISLSFGYYEHRYRGGGYGHYGGRGWGGRGWSGGRGGWRGRH
jgi:hypothetical protein